MKLLIDIPEEVVTKIQNGEDYRYDLHTTIAQGIPYESNGDLISRETLKQMLPAPIEDEYKRVHQIIDNIPSVEAIPNEEGYEMYGKGYLQGYERGKSERPKGKRVNHRNDNGHNIADCSLCGKATQWHDEDEDGVPRYCWYCGALMKGGAEND